MARREPRACRVGGRIADHGSEAIGEIADRDRVQFGMRLKREDMVAIGETRDGTGRRRGQEARACGQVEDLILMDGQKIEARRLAACMERAGPMPVIAEAPDMPASRRAAHGCAEAMAEHLMAKADANELAPRGDQGHDARAQRDDPGRIGEGVVTAAGQDERVVTGLVGGPLAGGNVEDVIGPIRAAAAPKQTGIGLGETRDMRRDLVRQPVVLKDADTRRRASRQTNSRRIFSSRTICAGGRLRSGARAVTRFHSETTW